MNDREESVVIIVQSCEMKCYGFTQTMENMLGNACHILCILLH